jgi:hypothetical protein
MFNIQTKFLNGELIKRSSGFVSFVDLGISLRHSYHHHPSTGIRDTVWKTNKNYVVLVLFWVFSDMNISVLIKKIPISLWNWKKIEEFLKNIKEKLGNETDKVNLSFFGQILLAGSSGWFNFWVKASVIWFVWAQLWTSLHNFVHGIGKTWEIYL